MENAPRRRHGQRPRRTSVVWPALVVGLMALVSVALWLAMRSAGPTANAGHPVLPPPAPVPPAKEDPAAVAAREAAARAERLAADIEKLRPLAVKLGPPQPGDWLDRFEEPGQTFQQYLKCRPTLPTARRRVIHIQPLGEFTEDQRRVVALTADFMGIYFNLPVKFDPDLPADTVPPEARRRHPQQGMEQMLTGYILEKVLYPRLPDDAAACICFTATDLWPGEGWNFVFGQASLAGRVGVWSINRFGDPAESGDAFRLAVLRTMKLGAHETGHMFSMLHCTAYECNMCGCNSQQESDRNPLALCPECVAKLCWATGADPVERYRKLADFCRDQGLEPEEKRYRQLLGALEGEAVLPAGEAVPQVPMPAMIQEDDESP